MAKLTALLQQRFLKKPSTNTPEEEESRPALFETITAAASIAKDREGLEQLLVRFAPDEANIPEDVLALLNIASEVKAINNQAALLHGERIKKAQTILKSYREGAFTAWLMATYGNRQTPYNFLQYYEFHAHLPKHLINKLETMPRQAVYTLASRQGEWEKKISLVEEYQGETKQELITLICTRFPLVEGDGRREDVAGGAMQQLKRLVGIFTQRKLKLENKQKEDLLSLLKELVARVEGK